MMNLNNWLKQDLYFFQMFNIYIFLFLLLIRKRYADILMKILKKLKRLMLLINSRQAVELYINPTTEIYLKEVIEAVYLLLAHILKMVNNKL
jgi:hypothetical protein